MAWLYIAGLGAGWDSSSAAGRSLMVALIALGLTGQFLPERLFERAAEALGRMPVWGLGATAGIVVGAINVLGPEGLAPFIYFRF